MPLDPRVLATMESFQEEQEDEQALLDPEVMASMDRADETIKRRKKFLRDAYGWGLVAPLSGTRETYAKKALKEVDDPLEREWLVEEVSSLAKVQEWARNKKYTESGFLGRFAQRAQTVGGAFAEAGTSMVGAAKDLGSFLIGQGRIKEEVQFLRSLESAKQEEDPTIPRDAPLSLKAAAGATGMVPDLAAGLLAAATPGGPYAMLSYWTARLFPERREDYLEMGLSPGAAAAAGGVTSVIEGAVELLQVDPTGFSKGVTRPAKGVARRGIKEAIEKYGGKYLSDISKKNPVFSQVVGEGLDALERTGMEITEEGIQRGVRDTGKFLAAKSGEDIEGPAFRDIAPGMWEDMKESAPGIAVLGGAGAGGQIARVAMEAKQSRIKEEIVRYAKGDITPSRKRWWRDWGLPVKSGDSRGQRKIGVKELAAKIYTAEQIDAVAEGKPPTEGQWKRWGFPAEGGETARQRLGVLFSKIAEVQTSEEAATEATQMAPEVAAAPEDIGAPEVDIEQAEQRGAIGEFIEDIAGRVGISFDVLGEKTKAARGFMQRLLLSRGELPLVAFKARVAMDGQISRIQTEIAYTARDYRLAVKEAYGGRDLTNKEMVQVDSVLRKEAPIESIPKVLREPVIDMRNQIDALSTRLIEIGAVQGKMVAIVARNLQTYVTRSYRVFDDPKWAESVSKDIRNKATALLRSEYPDLTEQEIEGTIEKLLYEGKAAQSPIALLRRSQLGSKDLSILKRRKGIPPEIRALFGEYKDPLVNYARSMTNIGNLIANHEFLTQVREAGLGTFFSETPIVNDYGELKAEIAADESSVMNPLNGLHTTPEIANAFKRATSKEQIPDWFRIYLAFNGSVKVAKTVGSLMTHARNLIGNVGFAVMNGHWDVSKFGMAWRGTMTGLFNLNDKEFRKYYLRAIELGLVEQDVHSGALRDYLKDASQYNDIGEYAYNAEKRRAHRAKAAALATGRGVSKTYQAEDNIWKLYAWENEKARYREAMPELSKAELEEMTAEIVRNTYPTYSLVPEGVKFLRRFPLVGTFVSFPAEILRTTYHSLNQTRKELTDPRLRTIGATRLAGNMIMISGLSAVAAALRLLMGISRDDDESLRSFVPEWQKNNQFIHLGRTPEGNFQFIDLSYSDPHNSIRTPFMAFMRGKDLKSGLWDALTDAAEPFIGEEILFQRIMEARTNEDGRVWNPEDSVDQQAADITSHLWSAFEPGTITSMRRWAEKFAGKSRGGRQTYDLVFGRIQEVDIAQALPYRAYNFTRRKKDANNILSRVLRDRGSISQADIASAYQDSDTSRNDVYQEMIKTIQDATKLGLGKERISTILDGSGITERDRNAFILGMTPPRKISSHILTAMKEANPEEYISRVQALVEAQEGKFQEKRELSQNAP